MLAAILAGKDWRGSNTTVLQMGDRDSTYEARVFLHGNHIATIGPHSVRVSLAGWNTPTTRSRLNAILGAYVAGARVYAKAFRPMLSTADGTQDMDSREWYNLAMWAR